MHFFCIHNCKKFIIFTSVDITKYFKYIPFQYVRECPKENFQILQQAGSCNVRLQDDVWADLCR